MPSSSVQTIIITLCSSLVQFVASTVAGVVRNLFNRRRNDSDEFDD